MSSVESVDRVTFTVETLFVRDGQKLGRLRSGEDGYYENFPMAALGVATRNNTYYDVSEFVDQITNPETYFNRMLADGTLYGEYGHPTIAGMDHAAQLNRLSVIAEDRVSHHFRRISTGNMLESGGRLITADIKPSGPYGKYLQESLEEPHMNTAFSLRSITMDRVERGLVRRKMRKLVTFDAVAAGGYAEASKRFLQSNGATESLEIRVDPNTDLACFNEIALESFAESELADIFGTKNVEMHRKNMTVLKGTGLVQIEGKDGLRSLYHELVKGE